MTDRKHLREKWVTAKQESMRKGSNEGNKGRSQACMNGIDNVVTEEEGENYTGHFGAGFYIV